jgi:hypothetical protein
MAQQTLLLGTSPNDGTGDPARTGGGKINANFTELYTRLAGALGTAVQGSVYYDNGTAVARLGPGTAGQVLTSGGPGVNPSWSSLASFGLSPIANNTLLANISGGASTPTATALSALIDAVIGNARGDVLFRAATSWSVLAPGTAGYLLQTGGASADPSWVAPPSGTGGGTPATNLGNSGSAAQALAFPAGSGNLAYLLTLTGNPTITITGGTTGQEQTVRLYLNGGVGGFTPTWPSNVTWKGSAPTGAIPAGITFTVTFRTANGGSYIEGEF